MTKLNKLEVCRGGGGGVFFSFSFVFIFSSSPDLNLQACYWRWRSTKSFPSVGDSALCSFDTIGNTCVNLHSKFPDILFLACEFEEWNFTSFHPVLPINIVAGSWLRDRDSKIMIKNNNNDSNTSNNKSIWLNMLASSRNFKGEGFHDYVWWLKFFKEG